MSKKPRAVISSKQTSSHAYPRPQLVRSNWTNLNGKWDFAIDADASHLTPDTVSFNQQILVPFAPESPASGVNDTSFYNAVWYRREIPTPQLQGSQRAILHFGAVDTDATVYVNGRQVCHHEGGYTPFKADITDSLVPGKTQTIIVRAHDNPHDLSKPRGKQDWRLEPHSIWYYRTTGIWQTVWLEIVSASHLTHLKWTPDMHDWTIQLRADLSRTPLEELQLEVTLTSRDRTLAHDTYAVTNAHLCRTISLPDPGIDDYRNELLWWPHNPVLINATLTLRNSAGDILDEVQSYTAMRSAYVLGDRFMLNNRPYTLQFMLDQGYWPESGLTAPSDDALRRDVELVKEMGFNGVRKHQKIEDPRFLYWADHLGILVWEEMPSAYAFTNLSVQRLTQQWMEAIHRDSSHPCIVAWVPFNESWAVPDLPTSPAQVSCIQALYHLTKTLDPTRPCIGNDGWEAASTDILGIHDYDADPRKIAKRYDVANLDRLLKEERPGHKILLLTGHSYNNQPIMLTEFGGIAFSKDTAHTWGYSRARNAEDFALRYAYLLSTIRALPMFAGFCYTQFTDTYQEANGLLYMDRTPKFPLDQIACATRGPRSESDQKALTHWKQSLPKRIKEMDETSLGT